MRNHGTGAHTSIFKPFGKGQRFRTNFAIFVSLRATLKRAVEGARKGAKTAENYEKSRNRSAHVDFQTFWERTKISHELCDLCVFARNFESRSRSCAQRRKDRREL